MTLARDLVATVATYALSLAGRSRDHLPVPWTASAVMDDCAAFCSHVLWGGKPGPIIWVDGFKSAGDGSYAAGGADLQPWDVLLFDWDGNGVGNHVEFFVADVGGGFVRTFGANGSDTRAAAYRLRPRHYILGRFRPRWTNPSTPTPPTIIDTQVIAETDMTVRLVKDTTTNRYSVQNIEFGVRVPINTGNPGSDADDLRDLEIIIKGDGKLAETRLDDLNERYFRKAGPLGLFNLGVREGVLQKGAK